MKSNKRKINESIDLDEVYDELENQGIRYSANEVGQGVKGINWDINEEDIPLCVAGLLRNKVQLTNVQSVTYDEGEFTEWLENDQNKFDGGYQVSDHTGTTRYFGWNYGGERTKELFIQKKVIFTTKAPVNESTQRKNLREESEDTRPRTSKGTLIGMLTKEVESLAASCNYDEAEFRRKYMLLCFGKHKQYYPVLYKAASNDDDEAFDIISNILKKYDIKSPEEAITESSKKALKAAYNESCSPRAKESKLLEGMNGCFYVIHESPIGYRGRQGWIDDYSELTSDVGSAEQYDTLQEAVDMLYAIEDYVENFNEGEGIRATIQCVNPDDPNQVLEDMAVVDIQKLGGMVDCEPVEGEQNLINCGYLVDDEEPSMGYNL